jgi:hypothetical protein
MAPAMMSEDDCVSRRSMVLMCRLSRELSLGFGRRGSDTAVHIVLFGINSGPIQQILTS